MECEYSEMIFVDPLIDLENKYYFQVYLDYCIYRIADNHIINYLDDNPFDSGDESKSIFYDMIDEFYKYYTTNVVNEFYKYYTAI